MAFSKRLQEQLRRIKRNEEKEKTAPDMSRKKKKEVQLLKSKVILLSVNTSN